MNVIVGRGQRNKKAWESGVSLNGFRRLLISYMLEMKRSRPEIEGVCSHRELTIMPDIALYRHIGIMAGLKRLRRLFVMGER